MSMPESNTNSNADHACSRYESIKTVTAPTKKASGQLGGAMSTSQSEAESGSRVSEDRDEQTAEKIRYDQAISESGMGGKTTTVEGVARQGGYGGTEAHEDAADLKTSRREQKYGPGSNVGA